MSRKQRPIIPRHFSRFEENCFREQPLLLKRPEDTATDWRIDIENSVSYFIPIDSRNGLSRRGSLIDGRVESSSMRILQCLLLWIGWLNPKRWLENIKPVIMVLHRNDVDDAMNELTAAGILIYFQHEPILPAKNKEDMEDIEDVAQEPDKKEEESVSLKDQIAKNAEEFFEMCYLMSAKQGAPQPKRAKQMDPLDIFPQFITDKGIVLRVVKGPLDYQEHIDRCMPEIFNQHPEGKFNYAAPFYFDMQMGAVRRVLGQDSKAYQWIKDNFYHDNTLNRVSFSNVEDRIDVYFPAAKFASLPQLFSVHIPRKFDPPLSVEKIREYYESKISSGRKDISNLPEETFTENDVYYVAFGTTYGHSAAPGIEYPKNQGIHITASSCFTCSTTRAPRAIL